MSDEKIVVWLTDIHLNFLEKISRNKFYDEIFKTNCDAVLISGDISEAPDVCEHLCEMASCIKKPIYFILGNHDYYRGNVSDVRTSLETLCKKNKNLYWLPKSGIVKLPNNTILLGQDGWADGRYGDFKNSRVLLNDSRMIVDLFHASIYSRYALLEQMQQFADRDADALKVDLLTAIAKEPKKIIVLTHVPPFKETCLYNGKISGDDYLPYYSSKSTGNVLLEVCNKNPAIEFLVLCGHTHNQANYWASKNLVVRVGKAEYFQPEIQEIIRL